MSAKNKIVCDRKGRPVTPHDVSRDRATGMMVIFLVAGALLLPTGLLLYNLVTGVAGTVLLLFAMLIFLGAILLMYGILLTVMLIVRIRRSPSDEEIIRKAMNDGETCRAKVVKCASKTTGRGEDRKTLNVYSLEYRDDRYCFTRRFVTPPTARVAAKGATFVVHYHADSNIGYYVETPEGGLSSAAR